MLYTLLLNVKTFTLQAILHLTDFLVFLQSWIKATLIKTLNIRETARISTWNGIPSVLELPSNLVSDFNLWRKPLYVGHTFNAIRDNKPLMVLNQLSVEILPDSKLIDWILNTPLSRASHITSEGDNKRLVVCDLSVCREIKTDDGTYLEGPIVKLYEDGTPYSIEFSENNIIYPSQRAHWDLAKLHFQTCAPYYIAGYLHGDIHFGLPCVIAKHVQDLPQDSVLYQLLAPHVRFTLHINNEALRVQRASDKSKPYAPFPVEANEFIRGITLCLKRMLLVPGFKAPHRSLEHSWSNYATFAQSYYNVIHHFVSQVWPSIDQNQYDRFARKIGADIANFENFTGIDALATFIWQVSIQHSAEHEQVYTQMELEKYQSATIRLPAPDLSLPDNLTTNEIIERAIHPEDRYKTVVFAHTFVLGHKHPYFDNSMRAVHYGFNQPTLIEIAKNFQISLIENDLAQQKNPAYVPLDKLIQSICW